MIHIPKPLTLAVSDLADANRATRAAREFASGIGFTALESEEVALTVSELASNLVRHAGGGSIKLAPLSLGDRRGIQIESEDDGPGISEVELAVQDGYSTDGGLGNGLGAVNRLMDEMEFHPRNPVGLKILCQRWVRPRASGLPGQGLECGAATRARGLAPENGDALVIRQWDDMALLGIIDGLGHGRFAQKAAQTACAYVEQHFDQPLENLFLGVGRACRATRGVVMALGRFDLARQRVQLASVGNVEVRLLDDTRFHMVARRGILGLHAPTAMVSEQPWTSTGLLVMHSDGLRTRWSWDDFQDLKAQPPAIIARGLLHQLGKLEDDATVLVARSAHP